MKAFFIAAAVALLILFCFCGDRVMNYASEGYKVFITSVFPALFPFLVVVNCINSFPVSSRKKSSGAFTVLRLFFISSLCGSPSGALVTKSVFGHSVCSRSSFILQSMLSAALNTCCPIFVIGTVCGSMLGSGGNAIYLLLISHYGSALLLALPLGICLSEKTRDTRPGPEPFHSAERPCLQFSGVFTQAVYRAMHTMLSICGTLVFCIVIVGLIGSSGWLGLLKPAVRSAVLGLIEMTSGVRALSTVEVTPVLKLCLISFLLSFGGASVMLQVCAVVKTDLLCYFAVKLAQGVCAAFILFMLQPLFPITEAVFSQFAVTAMPRLITFSDILLVFALSISACLLLIVGTLKRTRT